MWGTGLRLVVAFAWLTAGFVYWRAYRFETTTVFRPMRIYAVGVSFAWGIWEGYIGIYGGLLGHDLPEAVKNGSITLGLLVSTVAYFLLAGYITHRVVQAYFPPDMEDDDS